MRYNVFRDKKQYKKEWVKMGIDTTENFFNSHKNEIISLIRSKYKKIASSEDLELTVYDLIEKYIENLIKSLYGRVENGVLKNDLIDYYKYSLSYAKLTSLTRESEEFKKIINDIEKLKKE